SALVVAWPHPEWGQQVVALYTQRGALCEKELRSELKAQLANYKVPKFLICVTELPLSSQGKLDRLRIEEFMEKHLRAD
ncbi:MAG: long-chain fatty acid--CoA ligase, partial [Verrucomicrobiota bacterium]